MALSFTPFPKVRGGDSDDGSVILLDGHRIGAVVREFEYVDIGVLQSAYRNVVAGYRVELWALDEEVLFKQLAEARAYARKRIAQTLVEQRAMIEQHLRSKAESEAHVAAAKAGKAYGRRTTRRRR